LNTLWLLVVAGVQVIATAQQVVAVLEGYCKPLDLLLPQVLR
jgi:hypothetical protein